MAKKRNDCSLGERARYEQTYLATWDTVNETLRYKAILAEDPALPPPERLELRAEIRRLQAELDLLESKRRSFRLNKKGISPPSKTKVEKALKLSDECDEAIRAAKAGDVLLGIAEKALKLFASVQPG